MNESRTKFLLAVLGLLLLYLGWHYLGPSGGGIGDGGVGGSNDLGNMNPVGRVAQRETKPPVEEIVDLKVAELQPQSHEYRVGRDPWRFAEPPPPPPPPPVRPPAPLTEEQLRAQREAEELLRRQQEEAARLAAEEAARPKPPPFTLKYIGRFGPADRPIAVFTDPDGKEILNVQQGETIQGEFILSQVGLESVEIRFVKFPNVPAQRLPIGR